MAKTLRKLMMEELGTDSVDAADAAVDVVFDWLERIERNGEIGMASGWREMADRVRRYEQDGVGR